MTPKRWPLVLAIAAYFLAVVVWMAADRRVAKKAFDDFSTANTDAEGLSLASRYLHAKQLTRSLAPGLTEPNAVVFRVGRFGSGFWMMRDLLGRQDEEQEKPKKSADRKKQPPKKARPRTVPQLLSGDEEDFVRGGGRIVLAIGGTFGPLDVRNATAPPMQKVFPLWPGLTSIPMPNPRTLAGAEVLRRAHVLYVAGDGAPAMLRIPIGRGDVILSAQPELFDNAWIGSEYALGLLTALAANRPVYFDETIHGFGGRGGMLDLFREWRLGPFLLLLLALAAAIFWRHGRRVGEPEDDYRETRSDAVDLVRALGALYDRSMSDRHAIVLYRDALSRTLAATTGLRGDQLHKRLASLTGNVDIDGSDFPAQLAVLNEAFKRVEHG
ncbi:MAG: hypothetical protein JWO56_3530 [Acidobacteria bacterium]|nr:hypothetical protein [Acidobacteriota bacterium]